jgi:hypothetical protein
MSKPYNYTASETCQRDPSQLLHPNKTTLEIDNRILKGFAARDTLCLDHFKLNCVEKFEFYTVTNDSSKFFGVFSGMMGIIPNIFNPL